MAGELVGPDRHPAHCGCCKCKNPPPECQLNGVVSGHNIVLNWSYTGYAINKVQIIKQPNWWSPDQYDPNWEVVYSDDGTTTNRTFTVADGECMRYRLIVCNDCGCCFSDWTDGRTTLCDCFQCSEAVPVGQSGPGGSYTYKTVTRRYSGGPKLIQCGCSRGKVTAMAVTMSGMLPLYTSDVDRYSWNPNRDVQYCACPCTRGGIYQGYPINHNRIWRYNEWRELTGADCMNGTYVFSATELNFTHPTWGKQCLVGITPSYYKLGQVRWRWMEGQTNLCAQTNPEIIANDPIFGPCVRDFNYKAGPYTTTYDLYLIGSSGRRFINNDPMNLDPAWTEPIPLDGSTTGDMAIGAGFDGPRLIAKQVSTTHPSLYYQSRNGLTHLNPPCGSVLPKFWFSCGKAGPPPHTPWLRQLTHDRCSWRLDGNQQRDIANIPLGGNYGFSCAYWDFIAPPNPETFQDLGGGTYGGSLMSYANVDGIFTTEFPQIWP